MQPQQTLRLKVQMQGIPPAKALHIRDSEAGSSILVALKTKAHSTSAGMQGGTASITPDKHLSDSILMQKLVGQQMGSGSTPTGSGVVMCVAHSSPSPAWTMLGMIPLTHRETQRISPAGQNGVRALLKRGSPVQVAEVMQLVGDALPEVRDARAAMQGIDPLMDIMARKPSHLGMKVCRTISTSSRRANTTGSAPPDHPGTGMTKPTAQKPEQWITLVQRPLSSISSSGVSGTGSMPLDPPGIMQNLVMEV